MAGPDPDTTLPPPPQRARGHAHVAVGPSGLRDLRQEGCLKVLFPGRGSGEAVLLNTAGGLTGGDRTRVTGTVEAGGTLTLTTQAAERAYRATETEPARAEVALGVAEGARLCWLPQETILYEGAALCRRIEVDLAPGAGVVACEALIFGRHAMGERFTDGLFTDTWRVRRGGTLIWADALRLGPGPAAGAALAHPWGGGGAGAMATLFCAAPGAEALGRRLRACLGPGWGVTVLGEDALVARGMAGDGHDLRRDLVPAVEAATGGPLPKVWRL